MKDKRTRFFKMDDTLRMIFAFYSCISNNPNWVLESEFSKQNRKIAKDILSIEDMADYYFLLQGKFYGFVVEKVDEETILCQMDEYETFYDLADEHLSMQFSYHLPSKTIIDLQEIQRISNGKDKKKQKVA